MVERPKYLFGDYIEISKENGFFKGKAKPIVRKFMYGSDYIRVYGKTVKSLENERQTVTSDSFVMFDDVEKLLGYPASEKAFSKYKIKKNLGTDFIGEAVKNDPTEYQIKKMGIKFKVTIRNGDELIGKKGDYLVVNVANEDYRIIAAKKFPESYAKV